MADVDRRGDWPADELAVTSPLGIAFNPTGTQLAISGIGAGNKLSKQWIRPQGAMTVP